MKPFADKKDSVVEEACRRLLSRALNARGLTSSDVKPRVAGVVKKYLYHDDDSADLSEVRSFIDEMRADDLCLVIACERGDEDAWVDLLAKFDPTVRSAARKICSNSEEAEELAGSIWAELYGLRQDAAGNKKSKLAYYSGRGSLAGWLRAVVSQSAVDRFRRESRIVQVEENSELEKLAEKSANNSNLGTVVSHTESPEELFSQQKTSQAVATALKRSFDLLEPEDRLVLKLYYFDDLKLKDIARTFGYHEATASRKIGRLHSEIRRSVEKLLREDHGWTETEVRRYLSEAALKLGISVEKLFAVFVIAALLQDLINRGVQ